MRGISMRTSSAVKTRLGVDHFGREAGGVGGAGRHHFTVAEHVMEGKIASDADDVLAGGIGGDKAEVGNAAAERGEYHLAAPERQGGDTGLDLGHVPPRVRGHWPGKRPLLADRRNSAKPRPPASVLPVGERCARLRRAGTRETGMRRLAAIILAWMALVTAVAAAGGVPLRGVALVIGEAHYAGLPALKNPPSDAAAIGGLLGRLGFAVTPVADADHAALAAALEKFALAAKDADVALVYYSGHGLEAGGENYLVPVDADLSSPAKAGASLVSVSGWLDDLAKAVPVTIVLLDACRTGAFPRGTAIIPPGADAPVPAAEAGLAVMRGPTPVARADFAPDSLGMVIGFAASPGQPALDGAPGEANSPYAAALLRHLGAGGYSFSDVMTMVTQEVYLKT